MLGQKEIQATLTTLSARELAKQIASGEISSVEAVKAHIERIEQVNPVLNAVVTKRYEAAYAEARQADERRARGEILGPLHGVPITIKESLDLQGTASTFGLPSRATVYAEQDDIYVARLRQAGAIILGKTNVSQLLLYIESDNPLYGCTRNPWNLDRSAGGSSGGQAAIIAAGGSPLGSGTDIGGSLRVPATFCGVTSFRPTAGRTPDAGRYSVPFGERAIVSQVGALAREVEDVILAIEIIAKEDSPANGMSTPLGDASTVDISRLRVAYYTDDGTMQVAPAVRRAVTEAAAILKAAGANIVEWCPPNVSDAVDLFYGVMSAGGGHGLKRALGSNKVDPRIATILMFAQRPHWMINGISGLLKLLGQNGLAKGIRSFGYRDTWHYWSLVEAQMDYQRRFLQALDEAQGGPFDVILCPACALPAFTHGASRNLGTAGGYDVLYNVLGYPTGVVPLTRVQPDEEVGRKPSRDIVEKIARSVELGSARLPVGVQVVSRPWQDHVALAAMQAIEAVARTRPNYPTHPPLQRKLYQNGVCSRLHSRIE